MFVTKLTSDRQTAIENAYLVYGPLDKLETPEKTDPDETVISAIDVFGALNAKCAKTRLFALSKVWCDSELSYQVCFSSALRSSRQRPNAWNAQEYILHTVSVCEIMC